MYVYPFIKGAATNYFEGSYPFSSYLEFLWMIII